MSSLSYTQQLYRLMNQMIRMSRTRPTKMSNSSTVPRPLTPRYQLLTDQDATYTQWLVSDLVQSGAWLQQVLDFTVQQRITSIQGHLQGLSLRREDVRLDLYESPDDVYILPLGSSFTNELMVIVSDLQRIISLLHLKGESLTAGPIVDYQHHIRYGYVQLDVAHFIKLVEQLPPTH